MVPAFLRRFEQSWPEVAVELVESADDRRLLAQVEAAELDFAFASAPLKGTTLESRQLLEDPYVLFVAADSPLAAARRKIAGSALS